MAALRAVSDEIDARRRRQRRAEYRRYLRSPSWTVRRQSALARAAGHCRDCGRALPLEVHHLTYARVGREHKKDLRAICANCHAKRHSRRLSPVERWLDRILN